MAVTISGDTGISAVQAGAVESGDLPAGSVIQVVQESFSSFINTTSESFIDSGLNASITPSNSSNKILVFLSAVIGSGRQAAPAESDLRILRNSTVVYDGPDKAPFINAAVGAAGFVHIQVLSSATVLDNPATNSSVNYKLQIRCNDNTNSGFTRLNNNNGTSTITLMEIAG